MNSVDFVQSVENLRFIWFVFAFLYNFVELNAYVIARYSVDGNYYRAQVVGMPDYDTYKVRCTFPYIDFRFISLYQHIENNFRYFMWITGIWSPLKPMTYSNGMMCAIRCNSKRFCAICPVCANLEMLKIRFWSKAYTTAVSIEPSKQSSCKAFRPFKYFASFLPLQVGRAIFI